MGHSRVIFFLSFASCIVVYLSVIAVDADSGQSEGTLVTKATAQQAVEAAKNSITEVCRKAQNNIDSAGELLQKVKQFKQQADEAATLAQTGNGIEEAKAIIANIKIRYDTVNKLYQNATTELESANTSMEKVVREAKRMEVECNTVIPSTDKTPENYTEEQQRATEIKTNVELLNTNITDASTIISGVQSTEGTMEQNAKEAQLLNFHVSVIVSDTNIETMIGKANSIIDEIQRKNIDVNRVVEEMKKQCKKDLSEENKILKQHCQKANDALTSAKGAATQAQKAETDMKQQKGLAEDALANVAKTQIDVTTARKEANAAKACVRTVEQNVEELNNALQTAKDSVTKANDAKQEILTAMSKATSAPTPDEVKETAQSDSPVGQNPERAQKDAIIQPLNTETEQPMSKDSLGQSDSSADNLKDPLIKGAQNVSTTALTGGKAPAPGANNDSAMTVSVPLLVALIASAALQ